MKVPPRLLIDLENLEWLLLGMWVNGSQWLLLGMALVFGLRWFLSRSDRNLEA